MRAIDVMVRDVVTVRPDTDVAEAVKLLAEHDVSALPVLDKDGNLVGVLSEADLIHRAEIGTEKHRPWRLEAVTGASTLADEFAKSHGKKVGEAMTDGVISVAEETPLSEIAALFERKRIKRVPVVKDGRLVGIVSRSNLIQALASVVGRIDEHDETDRQIRLELHVPAARTIVDRFRQPEHHSQRPCCACLGARRVGGGAQSAARACRGRARSIQGFGRNDPGLLSGDRSGSLSD